ncbi:dynamin family protein [Streptomyces hydrogenans]|uniref:dynamin family protein n=1 Tax=Streptomyces hydrogenans TaxID=1873719 RepID=UPI0035D93632
MDAYGLLRSDVLEALARAAEAATREGAGATAASLEEARAHLLADRLRAVLIGEFKAGKSSLLNALLDDAGEPPLLPEAEEIATSVPVSVSYADPETIEVVRTAAGGDRGAQAVERVRVDRQGLRAHGTEGGNPENRRGVLAVTVGTPALLLRPGLTLVDTPGLGGPHLEHNAATLAALPGADAVLHVLDSTQPVLRSHLDTGRRAASAVDAAESPGALSFVLTKSDSAGFDEVLADARVKLAKETGRAPEELLLIPVSARAHVEFLRYGEDEDRVAGNMAGLRAGLWATLAHRGVPRVLGGPLEALGRGLQALLGPLEGQIRALEDGTRKTVAELRDQALERQKRLAELQKGKAEWRADLRRRTAVLQEELHADAVERHAKVWDRLETYYLEEESFLTAPQRLVEQLTADAGQVVAEVNARAEIGTAAILAVTVAETGLTLGEVGPAAMTAPTDGGLTIERRLGDQFRSGRLKRRLRDVTFGGSVGSSTGAVLGSVVPGIGTAVGLAVGGLVGMVAGWRSAGRDLRNEDRRLDRESLRNQLAPLRRNQSSHITKAVKDISQEFRQQAETEMELRISQEQETNRRLIEGLRQTEELTTQAAELRLAALRARRKPLAALGAHAEELSGRMRAFCADVIARGAEARDEDQGAIGTGPAGRAGPTSEAGRPTGSVDDNSWADD